LLSAVTLSLTVVISNWVTEVGISPYRVIGMIAVVTPLVSFLLQKLWVFSQ
jgi:hypothetical protein